MRLLLDTHVFLWWCGNLPQLSKEARVAITAPANTIVVSAASGWEIAIKSALGLLRAPAEIGEAVDQNGFERLPVGFEHTARVAALPQHHRDPFDRLLIAQALVEGLTIVTRDRQFARYDAPLLWV